MIEKHYIHSAGIKSDSDYAAIKITASAISKTGRYIAIGITHSDSAKSSVCIINSEDMQILSQSYHESCVRSISFSPDETSYLAGLEDSKVRIVNITEGVLSEIQGLRGSIIKVKYLTPNKIALISSSVAMIFDIEAQTYNSFGFGGLGEMSTADISKDGKRIAVSHNDQIFMIDPYTDVLLKSFQADLRIKNCNFQGVKSDCDTHKIIYQFGGKM